MCSSPGCDKGRVVKEKRKRRTNPQKVLGAHGISLLEFVGDFEPERPFVVDDGSGHKTSYDFSNTESKRALFVDKAHAEKLLSMTNARGEKLFIELAAWGARVGLPPTTQPETKKSSAKIVHDVESGDDLPSGFAPSDD